jgi:predicted transglutaminase-like cysteine proteinase
MGLTSLFKLSAAATVIAGIMGPKDGKDAGPVLPSFIPAKASTLFEKDGITYSKTDHRFLQIGGPRAPLLGHVEMCAENAEECSARSDVAHAVIWDSHTKQLSKDINQTVNLMIHPKSDEEQFGKADKWNPFPEKYGDCEDYVIQKRRMLIAEGIPASSMMIALVKTKDGEGHAVLVLRTTDGDKVFDNLTDEIKSPRETGHKFIAVTDPQNNDRWLEARTVEPLRVNIPLPPKRP